MVVSLDLFLEEIRFKVIFGFMLLCYLVFLVWEMEKLLDFYLNVI